MNITTIRLEPFQGNESHLPLVHGDTSVKAFMSLKPWGDGGPSGIAGTAVHGKFARELGFDPSTTVWSCTQTHSLRVVMVCDDGWLQVWEGVWQENQLVVHAEPRIYGDPKHLAIKLGSMEADGIVTNVPTVLGVTVADCLPIILTWGPFVGLLHSGWQGTGIVLVALKALESLGNHSNGLDLCFGPSVQAQDYPVPHERSQLFVSRFGQGSIQKHPNGQDALDITATNVALVNQWLSAWRGGNKSLTCSLHLYLDSTVGNPMLNSYRRDGANFKRSLVLVHKA